MQQPENTAIHPAGKKFLGTITDHGFSETKSSNSQVFVTIENNETQEKITAFLSLTDRAVEWTVKKLRACGYTGFDFNEIGDGSLLAGNQVLYDVEHEEYEGRIIAKVGWIYDPNKRFVERSQAAQQNAARFNDILKQHPPENAAQVAPQAPATPPPPPAPAGATGTDGPPF